MSKFKAGDRVVLEGVIEDMDASDLPFKIRYGEDHGAYEWVGDGPHIALAELVTCGPEQLETVTKERDEARAENDYLRMRITKAEDTLVTKRAECAEGRLVADALRKERDEAREQLARVCAQVETLSAELKTVKAELTDEYNGRTNAMSECIVLRERCDKAQQVADGEATHNRILRNRIDELERFCSRDRRILDCMETLLGMRER